MDLELERLADLLAYLIEKYGDKIELESLPDPPRGCREIDSQKRIIKVL